jgi:hypothetical protein
MSDLSPQNAVKRTWINPRSPISALGPYGLSRPDGGEELADFGLEALVFVGEQLR